MLSKFQLIKEKLDSGEYNNIYHFLEHIYEKLPIHIDLLIHTIPNFFSDYCVLTVDIFRDPRFQW